MPDVIRRSQTLFWFIMPSLLFKYIIIGDTEVGKSSLLLQFTERQFRSVHDMTIGVEMGSRSVIVAGQEIKLEIWDTAGQESFLALTRNYYRGADGCLLVFDLANHSSFDNLSMWLSEARQNSNNPNLVVMMIGNKTDLADARQVTREEAREFADANSLTYLEVSAKNLEEVEEAFIQTAEEIYAIVGEQSLVDAGGLSADQAVSQITYYGYDCCS